MVCKEDVLLWFKDLDSYKRIDVLYEILNMCLPFELRFIGSCIEEIGKHTYQELHGPTLNANDLEKLSKDASLNSGLLDETVRHKVLIYLSLLSSRNYIVANWLYKNVLRTDCLQEYLVKESLKDETVHSEFLLLFVMVLHHPAFTFNQKLNIHRILNQLIDLRESRTRISPKPHPYGCPPPGFTYQNIKLNPPEVPVPVIPVKTAQTMTCIDDTLHQQPAGMPPHVPPIPPPEFIPWSRPGFPCGAPEVPPPFPPSTTSPLVSDAASPMHSRSSSPHRTIVTLRSTPMPPSAIDIIPTQLPVEQLSSTNFPFMFAHEGVKLADEDNLNSIPEEKLLPEMQWLPLQQQIKELKPTNGIRLPCPSKLPSRGFPLEQHFQTMNLENEPIPLHRSNSSSNSSLNQTPPDTPAATPMTTAVLGRGEKARVNGIPQQQQQAAFGASGPGMSLCDTTSPPPPPFNSTVPFTTYPTFTALPTRSIFPYTQSYRPPFTQFPPTYQTNDNSFQSYSLPYAFVYSSPQLPPRNPPTIYCYNCGATGHTGPDCTGQNIEDITQKKTYTIDFAPPPLPDGDK